MTNDPRQDWTSSRLVSGMQYLKHPETGETLLDLDALIEKMRTLKTVTRWLVIVHEDTHAHWAACSDKQGFKRSTWARRFSVPEEKVWKITNGETGLADTVRYLLHWTAGAAADGKVRYSPDDVTASPGWDWENLVRLREVEIATTGGDHGRGRAPARSPRGRMLAGMSAREARATTPLTEDKIAEYRREYLKNTPPPQVRTNFYVEMDASTVERDALVSALAASVAGSEAGVAWPGRWESWRQYDGEPVLVLPVRSPADLVKIFGTVAVVRDALAMTAPSGVLEPVDTSSIAWDHERQDWCRYLSGTALHHKSIIIVCPMAHSDFMAQLAALYAEHLVSDDTTVDLSLPLLVRVDPATIACYLTSRYVDPALASSKATYVEIGRIKNNLKAILAASPTAQRQLMDRQLTPITRGHAQAATSAEASISVADQELIDAMDW